MPVPEPAPTPRTTGSSSREPRMPRIYAGPAVPHDPSTDAERRLAAFAEQERAATRAENERAGYVIGRTVHSIDHEQHTTRYLDTYYRPDDER